ncbi:glycerophosphodiester phosphodiesterase [Halopseudomonas nanhaiensis]|uniref:glycerophosphodiester phosphodiesterase n=1 Tax=Halopseudomonas nanhaiensis TaxID=2830842 RepID=UPI001CC1629B|nr:glycerophosphodiester phosphodiesterase [Halopseudomonas nanhaiensis]UAW96976.1 glycerophosphodiester phosphodiesterase [Halopseudomonas nanhaiensis]
MTLLYGHRGARGEAPENTLASFRRSIEAGVRRVELDLHLSSDRQLMVIHDPTLKRTTGVRGKVSQHTAAQLSEIDARHALAPWPEPCPIPTLETLFRTCPEIEHYQLEVKSGSAGQSRIVLQAIGKLVAQFGLEQRVVITSSSRTLLRYARDAGLSLPTGLVEEYGILDPIKSAKRYGCDYLILNWKLCTAQRVQLAQQAGLHVSVWTVNEPALMRRLADMGVDSLITDVPTLAMRTLTSE